MIMKTELVKNTGQKIRKGQVGKLPEGGGGGQGGQLPERGGDKRGKLPGGGL